MGKYDETLYVYFADEERFADFYNGAVFHGETIVQANMLTEAAERYVSEVQEYGRQLRKIRDRKAHGYLKKGKKVNRYTIKFGEEDKLCPGKSCFVITL